MFRGIKTAESQNVFKTLVDLGFDLTDAQIYVFLAKHGQQKASNISNALKINKQQLYPCLKKLQSKGIVTSTIEHPARFSVLPFEKVLDLFIKAKIDEAQSIQLNKTKILADWESIQVGKVDSSSRFAIIEGRKYIYSRIQQMAQETKKQLSSISSVTGLLRADQFGLFTAEFTKKLNPNVTFRFLTEISTQNMRAVTELLRGIEKTKIMFEAKTPEIGLPLFPRIVIKDDEEAVFFISSQKETSTELDNVCLWTNSGSLVCAFKAVFDELWRNASDIKKKIAGFESSKSNLKSQIIGDPLEARETYDRALFLAKQEVLMITSIMDLNEMSRNKDLLNKWAERGVCVRIMAPIVSDNFDAERDMSQYAQIRHVPASHLKTTIIDGEQLFQFPYSSQIQDDIKLNFENTFFTDDFEQIEKAKLTLNDIWNNASPPSANTLASILKVQQSLTALTPKEQLKITNNGSLKVPSRNSLKKVSAFEIEDEKPAAEQDIIDKIINGKKYSVKDLSKDLIRGYGSDGQAIIHSPKFLNLPDFMIHAFHHDKKSSYGNEDYLVVYLWLPTPKGNMFVPVAVVGDVPKGEAGFKLIWAGTPAGQNIQIVKKDQLQIQLHGNTFFAGWTVAIPLLPSPYILPPSAVILEAFGKPRTGRFTVALPSGYKVRIEQNGFEAFVTFIHSASKYSGPGTDGIINRDLIMTTIPPS